MKKTTICESPPSLELRTVILTHKKALALTTHENSSNLSAALNISETSKGITAEIRLSHESRINNRMSFGPLNSS